MAIKPDKNQPVVDPPATKTAVVLDHISRHRAAYIWLPLGTLAAGLALHVYYLITGRSPLDEVPVGAIWNVILCNVVVILVNCTKPLLFNDLNTEDPKYSIWQIALDYLATFFLLFGFWYALTH